MKAFLQLVDLCGGITLYIPQMESLKRGARDREIRARFDGGNYRTLAVQFRLGEKQIRKIINGKRH
jgi:Mor family transcriptional regulator